LFFAHDWKHVVALTPDHIPKLLTNNPNQSWRKRRLGNRYHSWEGNPRLVIFI